MLKYLHFRILEFHGIPMDMFPRAIPVLSRQLPQFFNGGNRTPEGERDDHDQGMQVESS